MRRILQSSPSIVSTLGISARHTFLSRRLMSKPTTTHSERTSTVFRSPDVHQVTLTAVRPVNPTVRRYVLSSATPIRFLPGQWLDVHVPGYVKPGGYTVTSPPRLAAKVADLENVEDNGIDGFELHLAIQIASGNPVTEFLWHETSTLLGTPIQIRIGGSFTWPPPGPTPQRVVFVAGGVGINPLMSMLSHIHGLRNDDRPKNVEFLYSFKVPPSDADLINSSHKPRMLSPKEVLFLPELLEIEATWKAGGGSMRLSIFVTGDADIVGFDNQFPSNTVKRRISEDDVIAAFAGTEDKSRTVGYVCGPPKMTDQMVQVMRETGLDESSVLCEKWW